jgi:hypothetical protein
VSLSDIPHVYKREHNFWQSWQNTHHQHLVVVSRREEPIDKGWSLNEARNHNGQFETFAFRERSPEIPSCLLSQKLALVVRRANIDIRPVFLGVNRLLVFPFAYGNS